MSTPTVHTLDPNFFPGQVTRNGQVVHLGDHIEEKWVQELAKDGDALVGAWVAIWHDAEVRYDDRTVERAIKQVRALSKRLRPYPAEQRLYDLIQEVTDAEDWRDLPLRKMTYITLRSEFEHLIPRSYLYRRGPHGSLRELMPLQAPMVIRMVETFVDQGLGFEVNGALGPRLASLRSAAWQEWSEVAEEKDIDIDLEEDTPLELAKLRLLLRLGLQSVPDLDLFEAVALLARELFSEDLSDMAPNAAIDEIVRWAEANVPLPGGKLKTVRKLCKDVWNGLLGPAIPTKGIVDLIRSIYPPKDLEERWSEKRVVEIMRACLRLLCRVLAQVDSWGDDLVEIPSQWFRAQKNTDDPKSIVGVSTSTYREALLEPLIKNGILKLETEGNRLEHTCAQYRINLER
jgi:hypothetical protein